MQVQMKKPIEVRGTKIGIVGPSKPQWKSPEQYEMMKRWIRHLLKTYMSGIKPIILKEGEAPYPSPAGFGIGEKIELPITIVSGHCPVGEEKQFCVTCNSWVTLPYGVSLHVGHELIKVFDQGGVDTEAEIAAAKLGCKTEIYPAPAKQWEDKFIKVSELGTPIIPIKGSRILRGYRSRNIQVANAFYIGYCMVPYQKGAACMHHGRSPEERKEHLNHPRNGGCWTLKYAKKLGKETHLVVIE